MFSLITGFVHCLFTKPRVNILVIGLDYAGKTTFLERVKSMFSRTPGIPPERIPPTIGMNLARFYYQGIQVIMWDLGGQIKMRNMWEKYYDSAHAIVFVVDSADIGRLEEAKLAYEAICDNDSISDIPIIILANKQDIEGALSPGDIAINFFAIQDSADRARVIPLSAFTGEGIDQAVAVMVEEARIHSTLYDR